MSEPATGDGIQQVQRQQALYQNAAERLLSENWGTRIVDPETGERKDTGVMALAEEVVSLLMSGKLTLNDTLVLRTKVNGKPALKIIEEDDGSMSTGIQVENKEGQVAKVGIGLQSEGLVANELLPLIYYAVSQEVATQLFRNNGGSTGPDGSTGYRDPGSANSNTLPTTLSGIKEGDPVGDGTGWKPMTNSASGGYPHQPIPLGQILGNLFQQGRGGATGCGLEIAGTPKKLRVKNSDLVGDGLIADGTCGMKVRLDTDGSLIFSSGKLRAGGINGTFTVVEAVSCSGGTLTVTTKDWTFTNGVLTGRA